MLRNFWQYLELGFKRSPDIFVMDNLRVSHVSRYFQKLRGNSTEAVLTRKAGGTIVINSIGTFLAFVLQILLARMLGAIEFGQYVYATTWIMLLTVVCKCGLDTAALRLLPQYKSAGQLSLLRGYFRWSSTLALSVSICVSLLSVLVVAVQSRMEQDLLIVFN